MESATGQRDHAAHIKYVMLSCLGDAGVKRHPRLRRRIILASDVQDLWYVRVDLLSAITSIHGEDTANAHLRQLNNMFEGLLPPAMSPRSTNLGQGQSKQF